MLPWKRVAARIEAGFDTLKARLGDYLGGDQPIHITPYRGYGTAERLYLKGRVLVDKAVRQTTPTEGVWHNLRSMYQRLETDEIPGAHIQATYEGIARQVVTDREGYFEVEMYPDHLVASPSNWYPIALELTDEHGPARATGEVLVPAPSRTMGIISDIDDTIIKTNATNLLQMARLTFLHNARTRTPFEGVAAFYQALCDGAGGVEHNPIFFISSSPWNLYDLLTDFMTFHDIPKGPLLLRDYSINESQFIASSHLDHKKRHIAKLLTTYPCLPFVLIGDSGQHDPEIYSQIVVDFPGRIHVIYIRDISQETRATAIREMAHDLQGHEVPLLLVPDTLSAARDAADRGLIDTAALDDIQRAKATDEARPSDLKQMLSE